MYCCTISWARAIAHASATEAAMATVANAIVALARPIENGRLELKIARSHRFGPYPNITW